jgi:hypothetical protein
MSRPRTTRLLPAALAVLALALGACGSSDGADEDAGAGAAQETATATSDATATTPTELTVDETAGTGRCMVPTAEALATQTTAFEGTVVALSDGTATLDVERWYTGGDSDQVTVTTPSPDLRALLVAVEFEEGRTYLVSAVGSRVSLCGFTAEKTPELEALYTQAFGS